MPTCIEYDDVTTDHVLGSDRDDAPLTPHLDVDLNPPFRKGAGSAAAGGSARLLGLGLLLEVGERLALQLGLGVG